MSRPRLSPAPGRCRRRGVQGTLSTLGGAGAGVGLETDVSDQN